MERNKIARSINRNESLHKNSNELKKEERNRDSILRKIREWYVGREAKFDGAGTVLIKGKRSDRV